MAPRSAQHHLHYFFTQRKRTAGREILPGHCLSFLTSSSHIWPSRPSSLGKNISSVILRVSGELALAACCRTSRVRGNLAGGRCIWTQRAVRRQSL